MMMTMTERRTRWRKREGGVERNGEGVLQRGLGLRDENRRTRRKKKITCRGKGGTGEEFGVRGRKWQIGV